jgi:protein SCO1/2
MIPTIAAPAVGRRAFLAALVSAVLALPAAADAPPAVDRKLGNTIPLDLTFTQDSGEAVTLRELFDRPVVLSLVYYRCPAACSPLLRSIARAVDLCDLQPGQDYRLVTISFDPREYDKLDLVRTAKTNLLGDMDRTVAPEDWAFLTGTPEAIDAICAAVGFTVVKRQEDYLHPVTLMFLSKEGKLTRYLNPTQSLDKFKILPADLKMAIMDASEGRVGTFMAKLERLCYGFDTDAETYVLKVNRLILGVTLSFVAVFGAFLLLFRRKARPAVAGANEEPPATTDS